MCWLETVTAGAQDSKVLEPIVGSVAVDVIELDRDAAVWSAFGPSAELAGGRLQPCTEETSLEKVTASPTSGDENLVKWPRRRWYE